MGLLAADSPHSPASKGAVRGDSGGCYDAFVCCSMRRVLRVRKIGPRRRTGTTVFRLGSMRLPPQGPPSPRGGGRSFGGSFIGIRLLFPFRVPAGCTRSSCTTAALSGEVLERGDERHTCCRGAPRGRRLEDRRQAREAPRGFPHCQSAG